MTMRTIQRKHAIVAQRQVLEVKREAGLKHSKKQVR